MNNQYDLKERLEEIITRCEDTIQLFELDEDTMLMGMIDQSEYMLDIEKNVDVDIFDQVKYLVNAKRESKNDSYRYEGMKRIIDYCFMNIKYLDLFQDYPTEEELRDKAISEMNIDTFQIKSDHYYSVLG